MTSLELRCNTTSWLSLILKSHTTRDSQKSDSCDLFRYQPILSRLKASSYPRRSTYSVRPKGHEHEHSRDGASQIFHGSESTI